MNWLDTETKAILQKVPEPIVTPVKAAEFGLVLLRKGSDHQRLIRAIRRINDCPEPKAVALSRLSVPLTINPGLTEAEALHGQFELICCDAVAAFIRSEVLLAPDQAPYLDALFRRVLVSREFRPTRMDVVEVPATEAGETFVDQFLGNLGEKGPVDEFSVWVPYKKARIMMHWAARVGARVQCEEVLRAREATEDW